SGQTLEYSIQSGNDGNSFVINPTTGVISVGAGGVDFERQDSYSLIIEVVDNGSPQLASSATITINVTDVNELPAVALTPVVSILSENTATTPRIKVADITVTDDALGTNTLSLSGDDAGLFEIDGNELFLIAGTVLSFATNPVLDVTVNVDDSSLGGMPDSSASLSINVLPPADLLIFDAATGRWRMGVSNGSSFTWMNGPKWNPASGWTTFTGDYNGDGLTDGIGITSQNSVFFARNNGDGT
ncbi:MAG: cadherin repeat domain-containing protein, partial [Planctomycetaceae bacterium]|nr:cadherin repeat domain-containing protein [Planctomycetaceae bacterium]